MNAFGKVVFGAVAAGVIGAITAAIYRHGVEQGREDVAEMFKDPMPGENEATLVTDMREHGRYTPEKYQENHAHDMARAAGMIVAAISGIAISTMWTICDKDLEDAKKDRHDILVKLSKSICDAYSNGNQEQAYQRGLIEDRVGNIDWREGGNDGIEFMKQQLKHGPLQILEDMGLIGWTKTEYRG